MDDLQSNVDDFLDVMMVLKQSLGEASWHQFFGAPRVAPGVGLNGKLSFLMS